MIDTFGGGMASRILRSDLVTETDRPLHGLTIRANDRSTLAFRIDGVSERKLEIIHTVLGRTLAQGIFSFYTTELVEACTKGVGK